MKMQLKLMLLLLGVPFLLLTSCQKEDLVTPPKSSASSQSSSNATISGDVKITLTLITSTPNGYTGYFKMRGDFNAHGDFIMIVTPTTEDSLHCVQTLISDRGTLTIISNCNLATNSGRWHITGSTGVFKTSEGRGSLTMPIDKEGHELEVMTGKITWTR
jgi:hypothetical protein